AQSYTPVTKFTGRPDDALVIGDLHKDAKQRQTAINDSLMKSVRDSILAAQRMAPDTSWIKDAMS
ncbi:MAG: hypothetical protein IKM78_01280, partial [Prevotella sp.]|nr:hypothetical protein [Prevotella sp.]